MGILFFKSNFCNISFFIVWKFSYEFLRNKNFLYFQYCYLRLFIFIILPPEFNVNICQLPFWALTVYYSWKIYSKKNIHIKEFIIRYFCSIWFFIQISIYLFIDIDWFLFLYLIFIKKDRSILKYIITLLVFIVF